MQSDRHEQDLAQILKAGLPGPSAESEARALAALASVRPRRHPNLLTYIIAIALILLLAAGLYAAVRYFLVPGTLHFHDTSARFLSGDLAWRTGPLPTRMDGDISPDGEKVVYGSGDGQWPADPRADFLEIGIVVSPWNGSSPAGLSQASDQVNLTEIAGIGGTNCFPRWSPDGTMIAFLHCDPVEGKLPCEAGHYPWVMNADGSGAHRVTPEGAPPVLGPIVWSPDGSRLAAAWSLFSPEVGLATPSDQPTGTWAFTTDIWGTDIRPLPNVGTWMSWSPDGSMIVSACWCSDGLDADGRPGCRSWIGVTDAEGGHPRVLVEQFLSDADLRANLARHRDSPFVRNESNTETIHGFQIAGFGVDIGPTEPVWSPDSTMIAFLAAMPFDPSGPYWRDQIEVWVYDLTADELIQITDDDVGQHHLIWR